MTSLARFLPRERRSSRHAARFTALALTIALLPAMPAVSHAAAAATTAATDGPVLPAPSNAAMDAVAAMQPSTNIGNTLDAIPDETSWGNPPITKALFDTYRAQGFRSVRLPVTWDSHSSATAPYTIDPAFLARVKQVADWALSDGLYVVINVHHDSWEWISNMTTDHDNVLARFDALWTQIAAEFKGEPRKLLLESVNEPQFNNATDAQKAQFMDELNSSFVNIVRQSGSRNATRLLVLPTLGDTPDQTLMDNLSAEMAALKDPNLVASVHYYSFWPFSVNIAGFTTFNAQTQQDLLDTFGRLYNTFIAKGIPVYMGEYGLLNYPDYTNPNNIVEPGEALKYFELLGYEARINHVTTALWDAGNYLNRNTLQWRVPTLIDQIKSAWRTRSGTAASDLLFVPKSAPIAAQTVALNLNGTEFRSLQVNGEELRKGRDYAVSGDQLTLTAATLSSLVGDRAYGVDATLDVRFSKGVAWQIHVISNDTPVLAAATGTTSAFEIPTQFNGDVLATMEAKYDDGSNAGPASWTSYQQFTTAFAPDYPNNAIALTPAFFNSLTDGARVTLTFHFWSGALVTYHVTKTGTAVTGTTG
ncbi:MAG TPA: cellulase family glycosylhydrolase [Actinocrinis sp.]|uniref:cellulase family glycosylhydrolase n=1 Tax=Actinocrinis sp. TaxID=1920516 RepID=UPI002D3EB1F8|nr:cellulase family glycosylhydrolase [Actinocrinis sp.]HZU55183.1 cellulase family glycosylhydrolase [Actinocrinis sp.]